MAAVTSFPSSLICYRTRSETLTPSSSPSPSLSFSSLRLMRIAPLSRSSKRREAAAFRAVAEDGTLAPAAETVEESSPPADQSVSVPVSPSDMLTMFFKAEGTMNDTVATKISKALEEVEGISDLKVQTAEGIATVELTKQTTVQATGVASNLVEVLQSSGFKLQTLNLSFEDEEDVVKS